MKVNISYKVRLIGIYKALLETVHLYQKAVLFLCRICDSEWDNISSFGSLEMKQSYVEHLVHRTRSNIPSYDVPLWFENMPSYFRRAAISDAIGTVSSYRSNHDNWIKNGMKGGEPHICSHISNGPVFYRDNMYREKERSSCSIKIFDGHSYIWIDVHLRNQDVRYIEKHMADSHMSAPRLELKHGKAWLVFTFTEDVSLNGGEPLVVGCDLGINSDAALCLLRSDGTVLLRKFINFKSDKAKIWHLLNITRKITKASGPKAARKTWEYIKFLNKLLSDKIAKAIVDFAASYDASHIVFEYLDMRNHKTKSQKISRWRKNDIQKKTETKAHRLGIHISHVNAWNTSSLAFDGSGKVNRDPHNHALATFASGKQYNADLSASYNIAARFYIREILKTSDENLRSYIEAKVPQCMVRTTSTLSDLISLCAALRSYTS